MRLAALLMLHDVDNNTVHWSAQFSGDVERAIRECRSVETYATLVRIAHMEGQCSARGLARVCEALAPALIEFVEPARWDEVQEIVDTGRYSGLSRENSIRAASAMFLLQNSTMIHAVDAREQALCALADGLMVAGHPGKRTRIGLFTSYLAGVREAGIPDETVLSALHRHLDEEMIAGLWFLTRQ